MSKSRKSWAARLFSRPPTVAVVRLSGPIGAAGRFSRGLEDAAVAPLLRRAFETRRLAAVALAINSPGGAPVQSALIAKRIRDHAERSETPVIAFCEDVAASGGYMLACAADEIYADESSLIGSIGVISASFGFDRAIERLGVERRVTTAGANKLRLDPFQAEKPDDRVWLEALQQRLHANFIEMVREARGARLGEEPPAELFSGEVYLGEEALGHGLVDGIGRLEPVMRNRFGDDVRFVPATPKRGLFERISGMGARRAPVDPSDIAEAAAAGFLNELEHRAIWARYGL